MVDLVRIIAANDSLWRSCFIVPSRVAEVHADAARLVATTAKQRYQVVESRTHVPWWFTAVVHWREADQDWSCSIAQGDPWNRVSRHVPRGRGPFSSWENAALDALVRCPPLAASWPAKIIALYPSASARPAPWSPGAALTLLELYNGLGYEEYHHETSPYNWGATNHEERGKYDADGKYDKSAWDNQVGCAALLRGMADLDVEVRAALAA